MKANLTSGDKNAVDRDLQTFNPMFPTGAYFGQFSPMGPMNHRGLHPTVELSFARGVTVLLDWVLYWRHSAQDALYGIPGNIVRTGQVSRVRYIGHQPGFEVRWQVDRHTAFQLNYARFLTGQFLADTPPGRDTTYFALWMTYRF
jgi:Alginate export